jgi:hypothetical protein
MVNPPRKCLPLELNSIPRGNPGNHPTNTATAVGLNLISNYYN